MPSTQTHLVLRTSTWHCRIDIPSDLRPAFGNRRILSKSLRTGDKLLANTLAASQVGQWKLEFRRLRDERIRADDRWREELQEEALKYHASMERMYIETMKGGASHGLSRTSTALETSQGHAEFRKVADGLAKDKRFDLLAEIRDLLIEGYTPETKPRWVQRYNAWLQKVVHHRAVSANLLSSDQSEEARAIVLDPSSYRSKSPISTTAQDKFAAHLAEQNDNRRTTGVYLSHLRRFSAWLTSTGKAITFDSVAEYLDFISKARQTRQGHLAALRKFHRWAVRYDTYYRELFADKNSPFDGHQHPKAGLNAGVSWLAYTREEAERLHGAARSNGDIDLADLIAFASYTGCRIEELGRIRNETTIFNDHGQPVGFQVDNAKTKSGIREVPLHPDLVPIYERRLKNPYGASLAIFPGNDATKHRLRLNALSQRFTKLKRQEGFSAQHVFHSLRKTTATMLQRASVPPLTIPYILGHDVGNITFDIYSAGPTFEQKRDAICALEFSF